MSTHAAVPAQVERAMRQGRLIDADLTDFDSASQAYGLRLPPEDSARYPLAPATQD